MANSVGVIKPLHLKDLRTELRGFIDGCNHSLGVNTLEFIKKGFSLLKSLPVSKDAVLEVYASLYEKIVNNHLMTLEAMTPASPTSSQPQILSDNTLINELHNGLIGFIESSPRAWTLVISKWSLELLGDLSAKYSGRGRAPVNGDLSDSLYQWLSCRATRSLVDINMICYSFLVGTESEIMAINTLLNVCVNKKPHFDWVVAHVGGYYPEVVISRVLFCGLQDFCENPAPTVVTKLKSVVGILMHLAASNSSHVKRAMLNLFKWCLEEDNETEDPKLILQKTAVVPYLLKLGSSSVLLSCFGSDFFNILTNDAFEILSKYSPEWLKYFGSRQPLIDLVIHLICSSEESAPQILDLLFSVSRHPNHMIAKAAEELLETLTKELEVLVRHEAPKIPFMDCIQRKIDYLLPLILSSEEQKSSTAVEILRLIGQMQSSVLPKCVAYILLRSTDDERLATVVKLTESCKTKSVLAASILLAVSQRKADELLIQKHLWVNLYKLVKWESSGTLVCLPMLEAVKENLSLVSNALCEEEDVEVAHIIAELIQKAVETIFQLGIDISMTVILATISYFFICLTKSRDLEELKGIRVVCTLLGKLCQLSPATRNFAVRELLECALFRSPSPLFGAIPHTPPTAIQPSLSLLEENLKKSSIAMVSHRHSSTFHAGVIGNGKRKATPSCPVPYEEVIHNTHLLLSVLRACCSSDTTQGSLDAVIAVALLLVELISPDVMYNGLPWPEEEFCKVTVERDIYIRRMFDSKPVVWSLLQYIAYHRPALCYCSVLLRAMVATLMGQWSSASQQGHGPGHSKPLITTTSKILQIMVLGQLLPPPLTAISDVIPHISPVHVFQILKSCVWNYMRDHVPTPALFCRDPNGVMWRDPSISRPPKQYTETLRLVMLRNLTTVGALYHTLFVHEFQDDD